MKLFRNLAVMSVAALVMQGCVKNDAYEKNVDIPRFAWDYNFKPAYRIEITDTQSVYNIYVTMRRNLSYRFSNIWLKVECTRPDNTQDTSRLVEIPLEEPGGKPLGRGVGDVYEHRMIVRSNAMFPQKGFYEFRLEQNMRENPLTGIMSVGIRIEKAGHKGGVQP